MLKNALQAFFYWFRRHLAVKVLTLFLAGVIVPAAVIAIHLMNESSRAILSGAQREQTERARAIAEQMAQDIRSSQSLLATIVEIPRFTAVPRRELQRTLQDLLRKHKGLEEAAFLNASGQELVKVTRTNAFPRLQSRRNRPEYLDPIRTGKSWISQPFFSRSGNPQIILAECRKDRKGVLIAKFSLSVWQPLIERAQIRPNSVAQVVDLRGRLLAHPQMERVRAHTNLAELNVFRTWKRNPSVPTTFREYRDERGALVVAITYPVPGIPVAVILQEPRSEVFSTVSQMRRRVFQWTIFWLILFGAGGGWMVWRIVKPLKDLRESADDLTRGKREIQLNIQTGDELQSLGESFQTMADSIRQLENLRRDLIHMVVHDLKSPLTGLMGGLEYTLSGEVGELSENQQRFLKMAHRSGGELLNMIQNLLDIARMQEGKLPMKLESFSAAAWAEKTLAHFYANAEADGKTLQVSIEPLDLRIDADETLLGRVLSNLVNNALRHSPVKTGRVMVHFSCDGMEWLLTVSDNGDGIPEQEQQRIFDKFDQGTPRTPRTKGGSGLGLSFCKLAVEAHGGTISVESQPGQGALFSVRLPRVEEDILSVSETPASPELHAETF